MEYTNISMGFTGFVGLSTLELSGFGESQAVISDQSAMLLSGDVVPGTFGLMASPKLEMTRLIAPHPYFKPHVLLAAERNKVEIIEGDDDENGDDIHPIPLPKHDKNEGIPAYVIIDDRPPPPGWEPPMKKDDDSIGDGRRQGGIISIGPSGSDDDPFKVDFSI